MSRTRLRAAIVAVLTVVSTGVTVASGSIAQTKLVSENPADYTPNVVDDSTVKHTDVYAIRRAGATMFAGGTFHRVRNHGSATPIIRHNLFSFNANTGVVSSGFAPMLNAPVWAVQPYRGFLYVGGYFTAVNGIPRIGLAKINATSGRVVPSFNARFPSGAVTDLRFIHGRLIVAGTFPQKLVALNPATGADTRYIHIPITGSVADNAGPVQVYRFAVSPAGDRLVAVGNFTTVAHNARSRAFMLNLGATRATVATWYYKPFADMCRNRLIPDYLRDVDFSPGGSYFVIVSSGFLFRVGQRGMGVCDAAARFETNIAAPKRPTWINYTGGDTLHSVAVTGKAVYVQGHQRWLNNPFGHDSAGPGARPRPGIGAIDPANGLAYGWNPTKDREIGGRDFFVSTAGLWVASDGEHIGVADEVHDNIAFLPLS